MLSEAQLTLLLNSEKDRPGVNRPGVNNHVYVAEQGTQSGIVQCGRGGMTWVVLTPPLQMYSQASLAWACVLFCKADIQAELLCGGS